MQLPDQAENHMIEGLNEQLSVVDCGKLELAWVNKREKEIQYNRARDPRNTAKIQPPMNRENRLKHNYLTQRRKV